MAKDKEKRTNNDLQNTTHQAKDWASGTPLKPGSKLCIHVFINDSEYWKL
jgi:hypothetical protein